MVAVLIAFAVLITNLFVLVTFTKAILFSYVLWNISIISWQNTEAYWTEYRIPGNFRGMYISQLSMKQGFSRLKFRGWRLSKG